MWTKTEREAFERLKKENTEIFLDGYKAILYQTRKKRINLFYVSSFKEIERRIFTESNIEEIK